MTSSVGRRVLSHSKSFLALRAARKPNVQAFSRGMASSSSHGAKASSDMPWLIGSGLVTAAGVFYLLTPPSKPAAHKVATAGHPLENKHQPASSEGGAIRGERFTGETKRALSGGEEETEEKDAEPIKDDEGEEASGKEVGESIQKAEDADAPKDAKAAEENAATDSPKEDSPSDSDSDNKSSGQQQSEEPEKPSKEKKTGTVTDKEGPTPMGEARKAAKGSNAPKEASK